LFGDTIRCDAQFFCGFSRRIVLRSGHTVSPPL
jgi:hypothetical protein